MVKPLSLHVLWLSSMNHTEILLCFSSLPSLEGPIFLPTFPLHWWQPLHTAPCPRAVPPACTSHMYPSSVGPALPSVSQPVLLTCSLPSAFLFPSRLRAAPHPPAGSHCFLLGSYLHPAEAEVLQDPSKMARAKMRKVIMLESASTSPLICNKVWRLLSQN